MSQLPPSKVHGQWVQTDKATHEAWAELSRRSPLASQLMHLLVARVGEHNAVVISQGALADIAKASRRGVQKALKILEEDYWIEPRQIGQSGSVNAYVINDRVAWSKGRDGLRHSLFSATVVAIEAEQPDRDRLGDQVPLRRIPSAYQGEEQLPSGDGLPPVSQPFLGGLEPDLPVRPMADPAGLGARALRQINERNLWDDPEQG